MTVVCVSVGCRGGWWGAARNELAQGGGYGLWTFARDVVTAVEPAQLAARVERGVAFFQLPVMA